ncbi:MAG: hypothetical protein HW421_1272 [Ignavibacteria bacterium]|nr:hypothetical protein [Ignavibacteria bacterium]
MNDIKNKEPKNRILEAAAGLISQKGYSAVGVREIATRADVNVSMISYYFGGKIGILKAIIEEYFLNLKEVIEDIATRKLSTEENTRVFIHSVVDLIRSKPDLCKVAIIEMPYDVPEVREFKVEMLRQHISFIKENFHSIPMKLAPQDKYRHTIVGPVLISMIYSHFLFGNFALEANGISTGEDFYSNYSEVIATIFISGVKGLGHKNI